MKNETGTKIEIDICLCTFKRPRLLPPLLERLDALETGNLFDYRIIVIDNDRNETARPVAMSCRKSMHHVLHYAVEPEQNIAVARNRAISESQGHYVVFIDDDELPEKSWLIRLYQTLIDYRADGVLGPVMPLYCNRPPHWVIRGRFFERPRHSTGHVLHWTQSRTGNVLFSKEVFAAEPPWFDPKYGSGGEDRQFFKKKIGQGFVFVWCDQAVVYEIIPAKRWHPTVLMKRAFLRGKMACVAATSRPKSVLYSLFAMVIYTSMAPFFFLAGYHCFMHYLIKDLDHIGKVLTFIGIDLVKENYISG